MDKRTVSPVQQIEDNKAKNNEFQEKKQNKQLKQESTKESKQEGPNMKKQSSYTYWVTGKSEYKQEHAPKKIEENEEKKLIQNKTENKSSSSAWNTGGTWEHKTLNNDQVKSKLLQKMQKLFNSNQKYEFKLCDIVNFKGETTILVSRGKAKIGYDYSSIEFSWKGKSNGKIPDAYGTIKIKSLADDDPDERSVVFKVRNTPDNLEQKDVKGIIKKTASVIVEPLIASFKDLVENKI